MPPANNGGAKAVYKETTVRAAGVPAALLRKELGRFTASPNYMLNCGLGTVMLPILGVLLLVKSSDLLPVIYEMAGGEASGLLATMLCAALCLVGSMNDMASSSISLEGKNLWLAQSLPVTPWQVLRAKLLVQVLITGIPMAVTSVLILLAVRPALPLALLLIALPQAFVWLSAAFGLTMDLKRPNLVWTNEITVIKQRLTVLLAHAGRLGVRRPCRRAVLPVRYRHGCSVVSAGLDSADRRADAGAAALAPPHRQPPVRRPVIVSET